MSLFISSYMHFNYRFLRQIFLLSLPVAVTVSCTKQETEDDSPVGNDGVIVINESSRAVPGELIIKLKSPQTKSAGDASDYRAGVDEIASLVEPLAKVRLERLFPECGRFEARTHAEGLDSWYIATFDKSLKNSDIVKQLRKSPSVECIEYSLPLSLNDPLPYGSSSGYAASGPVLQDEADTKAAATARDASFPFNESKDARQKQWHYYNTGSIFNKTSKIGADANVWPAWEITGGDPDVIVAVIDQGVKYDHEDLAANMWVNTGEIPGNGIDDDGNGYVDDVHGYNFVEDKGTMTFSHALNHGTHVAGTIAAVNNNGIGVNGVAGGTGKGDGVRIMSLQTLGSSESGSSGSGLGGAVRAMKYAADNGAVISQNSWGYNDRVSWNTWSRSSFSAMRRAIDYFIKYAGVDENGNQVGPMKGGIVIFASGNEAVSYLAYPAADDKVVSVSAIAYNGAAAYYTNYGEWVDISAPGGDTYLDSTYGGVYSTSVAEDGSSDYAFMQGTSMACPHVSGACALAVSYYYGAQKRKGLTPDMLRSALLSSAVPVNAGLSSAYVGKMGVGRLDCARLLRYMDYLGDIPAVSLATGGSTSIELSDYFPETQVFGYTVADKGIVEAGIEKGVLIIRALKPGSTSIEVSDGRSMYKTIQIEVK